MSSEDSSEKTRVFIVDRHPAIREALTCAVERNSEMEMIGGAGSTEEALPLIEEHVPDVVVLEISLGEADGLTFIRNLRSRVPDSRILVFSRYDEDLYAERAVEAGASGYIMKTEPTEEVVRTIDMVSQGQVYLSRHVSSRILSRLIRDDEAEELTPLEKLTDRELTVFRKIGEGYSVRQIADQLDLNRKTIETYRRRAKEKLGHDSVEDLLRHAVQWAGQGSRESDGA